MHGLVRRTAVYTASSRRRMTDRTQWSDLDRRHCWLFNLPTRCDECLSCVGYTLCIYHQPDSRHLPERWTCCRHRPLSAIATAYHHFALSTRHGPEILNVLVFCQMSTRVRR